MSKVARIPLEASGMRTLIIDSIVLIVEPIF